VVAAAGLLHFMQDDLEGDLLLIEEHDIHRGRYASARPATRITVTE